MSFKATMSVPTSLNMTEDEREYLAKAIWSGVPYDVTERLRQEIQQRNQKKMENKAIMVMAAGLFMQDVIVSIVSRGGYARGVNVSLSLLFA